MNRSDMPTSQPRERESLAYVIGGVVAPLVYGALLLFPIIFVAAAGSTLTGMYEESIGYRYFYTLRTLYESSYLFLPQGDLANLIFKAIHLALSAVGYPPTQLFPRIDLFSYLSVAALQSLNVLCFWWAITAVASQWSRLLIALFWGGLNFIPGTSAIYAIIQPDYIALFPAFSLLATGSILRTQTQFAWSPKRVAGFSLFVGAALSMKFTLAILPAIALLHSIIMSRRFSSGMVSACLAVLIGFAIWAATVLVDARGNLSFVLTHFQGLLDFVQHGAGVAPSGLHWYQWIASRIWDSSWMESLIYGGPLVAGLSFLVARRRWELAASVSFLLGVLAYGVFLFRRDYPITILECLFPLAASLTVAAQFRAISALAAFKWPLMPALLLLIHWSYPQTVGSIIRSAAANSTEQRALRQVESQLMGKILWLVESNDDRPLSVDSAIMKGGYGRSSQWLDPPSGIMSTMFPNRDFRFKIDPKWPARLEEYGAVMFVYHGDLAEHVAKLGLAYTLPLSTWRCRLVASVSADTIAVCEGPTP